MRAAMHAVPRECAGSPLRPTAEGGLELDVIFERHRFRELMSLLESEPEWHDGELVHTAHDH